MTYANTALTRAEVDATAGAVLLEFGADWCGHCQAAQALVAAAKSKRGPLRHLKVEDGKGRLLGRSFKVKLWPTLILLHDGKEVARVTRPGSVAAVEELLSLTGA